TAIHRGHRPGADARFRRRHGALRGCGGGGAAWQHAHHDRPAARTHRPAGEERRDAPARPSEPVRSQAIFLAEAIALERLDPADGPLVEAWLTASLAGTPQVAAISYASADMQAVRAQRDDFGGTRIVRV